MKRTILAVALLGAMAGGAQAQSSVTVYGSLDGGVRHLTNANAAGDSLLGMSSGITASGISNSNRLGFKGVEDLGGGMNAHFVLESGYVLGRGAFTGSSPTLFNRQALLGITGSAGELNLGRQYSIALLQLGSYDPFLYRFPTIVPLAFAASADPASGGRFNNDIQFKKSFGPVTARVEYALGEVAGSTGNGSSQGVGLHYQNAKLAAGAAYTRRKPLVGTVYENNNQWLIGGAYTMGALRVAGGYIDERQDVGAGQAKIRNTWFGGSYNFNGATRLLAGFYRTKNTTVAGADGKRDLFIVSGIYALSKRTDFYIEADHAKFTSAFSNQYTASPIGLPAGGKLNQTGISIGINHLF